MTSMNQRVKIETGIRNVKFGKNVKVASGLVNLYECIIGDDCFVGPFVEIQKGVTIGTRTRVQSHSFICEFVQIGDDCFVGHGVMFINVLLEDGRLAGSDRSKYKKTIIRNNVLIGSNATILPVSICDNVVIGAGAVVTKDIIESGVYVGNPARFLRSLP